MLKIKLTQPPYIDGYEGAFYRFRTDDGKMSISGIWGPWYIAHAEDAEGNEYEVVWSILPDYDHNGQEEDAACDWDKPEQILFLTTGKPVRAEIE